MPRIARVVFAGLPHHVTQRGNRQGDVFFSSEDYRGYLLWLREYSEIRGLLVYAYCLMPNHLHLVVVPEANDSMHLTLKPLHTRYAQYINKTHNWHGHLWQGRYFSSALDDAHLWAAVRYVENNPVRAGLAAKAEDYEWSSAKAHCGLRVDKLLHKGFPDKKGPKNWSSWLAEKDKEQDIKILRRNTAMGLPCGSKKFIEKLENIAGRPLRPGRPGRPLKK